MKSIKRLNILPRWFIASIDGAVLFHAAFFAYLIRLNFEWASLDHYHVILGSLIFLACGLSVMFFTKSYVGIVRHTRMKDGVSLFKTIAFNLILVALVNWLSIRAFGIDHLIPNSVNIIASLLSLFILVLYRLLVKDFFGSLESKKEKNHDGENNTDLYIALLHG